ncbi:YhdP family protein [Zobellella aerophila]|uniref:YhdP family protein n=1 Tax=Zobellella aerophila TaxID=870480 RepID=A0ABP6VZ71_9GAMM
MLKRGLSWAWFALAGMAVLLALMISLIRFGGPVLEQYQDRLLARLLADSELSLQVEGMGLSWQGSGPVLVLNRVTLSRPPAQPMRLERAYIDLHFWQSLRQLKPVLNELTLEGLQLTAGPRADSGPGLPLETLQWLALQGVKRFTLQDVRLALGAQDNALVLHIPTVSWQNQPGLHQGQGQLGLGSIQPQLMAIKASFSGEPDALDGSLYLQADQLDASVLVTQVRPDDKAARIKLSFELWLEWQAGRLSAGLLSLGDNQLTWQQDGTAHSVHLGTGRVQWQPTAQGWQLASKDVAIVVDGESWPEWRLQLDRQGNELKGYLDSVTFADLALLAEWGQASRPGLVQQLSHIRPAGKLNNLRLAAGLEDNSWQLQGELANVSTRAYGWIPATERLNGQFILTPDSGRLQLQQQEASWVYKDAFRAPWPMRQLATEIHWQRQADGWQVGSERLAIETRDFSLQGWFNLGLPERGDARLSASANVDLYDASRAFAYFPEPLMGKKLVDYLQEAIKAGRADNAQVLWYGPLSGFPYADRSGIFQARVPLSQAEFQFGPQWQPLTDLDLDLLFENDGLYMTSHRGRLGEVTATQIDARIVPLKAAAELAINADIAGSGEAVTRYLQASPLAASVGKTLAEVRVEGPLTGNLALAIPLSGDRPRVNGQVDFDDNRVSIRSLNLPLDGVRGRLLFDDSQTRFSQLKATLAGQPLVLDYEGKVQGDKGYRVEIGLAGKLVAEKLAALSPELAALTGTAPWQGQLALELPDQGDLSYRFEANSQLAGLGSRLPSPLDKAAGDRWPSRLLLSGDQRQAELELQLGPQLRGQSQLRFAPGGTEISRLWLQAGSVSTTGARAPLDVDARLARLAIDDWIGFLHPLLAVKEKGPTNTTLRWPTPYRIRVQAAEASLWRQPLDNLSLLVTPSAGGQHRFEARSEQAEGEVRLSRSGALHIDLDRLTLALADEETSSEPMLARLRPDQLPAISFSCARCWLNEVPLGRLEMELEPKEQGVELPRLLLDGPLLQLSGHGQWLRHQQGALTRFEWQGRTDSLQALFEGMGQASPFSGTQASLNGRLRWLDAPWQPDWGSLNGEVKLEAEAGVLTELSDKGANFLSILSVESVLRRLRLDFRDVFDKGFYFEGIAASSKIQDGIMRSEDFALAGASGDLKGAGQVDLGAEEIDFDFTFTPHLTGNLPVIAAFAVTPVTGLYVLALSKILGPVVDVFTQIRYRVSGPLRQPEIHEVERERGQLSLSQEK